MRYGVFLLRTNGRNEYNPTCFKYSRDNRRPDTILQSDNQRNGAQKNELLVEAPWIHFPPGPMEWSYLNQQSSTVRGRILKEAEVKLHGDSGGIRLQREFPDYGRDDLQGL